ncbi:MotA/TolQ/ExbB proton channel family protein [bacterium]|nr:MotA/TolQ/ExbB proton channel family protein [bacterium]
MKHGKGRLAGLWSGVFFLWAGAGWAQEAATGTVELVGGPPAAAGMTLWSVIKSGGPVMVPIIFLSVLALALVIYLFIIVRRTRAVPREIVRQAWLLMSEGKFREAHALAVRSNSAAGRIVATAIARAGQDVKTLAAALQVAGEREAERLTDSMVYLSNIATIAPMLGLLGTVMGMIKTFNTIVLQANVVKPWDLAAGISEALITTAAGLIVAIPTMAMYYYFRGRGARIVTDLEELAEELADKLSRVRAVASYQEKAR